LTSIDEIIEESCNKANIEGVIDSMKELKIQEKYFTDVLCNLLNKAMDRNGGLDRLDKNWQQLLFLSVVQACGNILYLHFNGFLLL